MRVERYLVKVLNFIIRVYILRFVFGGLREAGGGAGALKLRLRVWAPLLMFQNLLL